MDSSNVADPIRRPTSRLRLLALIKRDRGPDRCLPELFRTQYFAKPRSFRGSTSPSRSRSDNERLSARRRRQVVLIAPVSTPGRGVYHNSAVVFDADGHQGLYRKCISPTTPVITRSSISRRATWVLCFDTRYANRRAHLLGSVVQRGGKANGARGAQRSSLSHRDWLARRGPAHGRSAQHSAWETVQRGHAIGNGVYVAAVNRVGHEGGAAPASSFGPVVHLRSWGVVLARGSNNEAEVLIGDCDRRRPEQTRRNWPFLRDRRIDAYAGLLQRYGS